MRHQLVLLQEVRVEIPEGGVTDDSFFYMLKSGIVGAVPGEVCVLLE